MNQTATISITTDRKIATHSVDILDPVIRGNRKWVPTYFLNVNGVAGQAALQETVVKSGILTQRDFDRARARIVTIETYTHARA